MPRSAFALFNLVLILGTFLMGIRAYLRSDPDLSAIRGSHVLGPAIRGWYFGNLEPFEELFVRRRLSPAVLSYGQLLASVFVGLAYAAGMIYLAGVLVLFMGTLDILDGKVARRSGGATRRGAFLDSVIDRYAEFFGYVGLLVFFGMDWHMWAVLFGLLGGMMVSYTRARAEGLGLSCEIGLLQRPERFVLLGFGSIFSSIATHGIGGPLADQALLGWTVLLLAVLSNVTALQRARFVWEQLR